MMNNEDTSSMSDTTNPKTSKRFKADHQGGQQDAQEPFDKLPNFFVAFRLDVMEKAINQLNNSPPEKGLTTDDHMGFEGETDNNRIDGGTSIIETEKSNEESVAQTQGMVFEKIDRVVSDEPVEYDDFEQLSEREVIKIEGEIKLKISKRGNKKKGKDLIEEEAPPSSHTFSVVVYKGVVNEDKPPVEEHRFVLLSAQRYIRFEELKARLEGNYASRYMNDWELDKRGERPFTLWNSRGSYEGISVPSGTFVGYKSKRKTERSKEEGVKDQFDYWKGVARRAESPRKQRYQVVARYWDSKPSKDTQIMHDNIVLRFEASHEVNKEVLKKELLPEALKKCHCQPKYIVVGPGEGDKPNDGSMIRWVLIGKHLFNLYKLYASPETIGILRKLGQQQEPRPFPTAAQAQKAVDELFKKKTKPQNPPRAQPTETSMTQHKVSAAVGADRVKGQAAAMNNVSATKFAEFFHWPKNTDDGTWKNQAEWLHRSAFSFGGLNETAKKLSSQSIDNLIFGTKEANSFMIRPESTIKNLTALEFQRLQALKPQSKKPTKAARPGKITGTVSTKFAYSHYEEGDEPNRDGLLDKNFKFDEETTSRFRVSLNVKTDANPKETTAVVEKELDKEVVSDKSMAIDSKTVDESTGKTTGNSKWMKANKYPWLAPQLEYEFQIELRHLNRSMNAKLIIEPFSRVIPMRLEAELDKLVEEYVFGSKGHNIQKSQNTDKELPRKRADSWFLATVGRNGKGTKRGNDP